MLWIYVISISFLFNACIETVAHNSPTIEGLPLAANSYIRSTKHSSQASLCYLKRREFTHIACLLAANPL